MARKIVQVNWWAVGALAFATGAAFACSRPPGPANAGAASATPIAAPAVPSASAVDQAADASAAALASAASSEGAGASAAPPAHLVVWDGEQANDGKSWAECTRKDAKCKSALTAARGAGVRGTTGLKWHAAGPEWIGSGWNWLSWYPQGSGTDVSAYATLTFQMKLEAKNAELGPDEEGLGVGLNCGRDDKCSSARVPVHKYAVDFADGKWHRVAIPMADLVTGEGASFDKATAWEFDLTQWSQTPRDFTVYVDDIAFER